MFLVCYSSGSEKDSSNFEEETSGLIIRSKSDLGKKLFIVDFDQIIKRREREPWMHKNS